MDTVESLKLKGEYFEAGREHYRHDKKHCVYGCHYGMRSERAAAVAEFKRGYDFEAGRE